MVESTENLPEPEPAISFKDMNLLARQEFIRLINTKIPLDQAWKDTISLLVSERLPDDLSPLQELIDGVPHVETETT